MVLLLTVFYILADAFVYMPIRYLMFKDKLRYSYSKTMSFLFAISLIEGVLYYFLQNAVTSKLAEGIVSCASLCACGVHGSYGFGIF